MAKTMKKIILPTPTEFIRHVNEIIFFRVLAGEEVDTALPPLVSRAKNLVNHEAVLLTSFEKEETDG